MSQNDLIVDIAIEGALDDVITTDSKGRNWFFTVNNPRTREDFQFPDSIKYAVWQLERGEEGTEHFHFMIRWANATKFSTAKKFVFELTGVQPHVGRVRNLDKARDYCMKEETRIDGPWEHGTWEEPKQGKRSDLDSLGERMSELASQGLRKTKILKTIAKEFTSSNIKYDKGITATLEKLMPEPKDDLFIPRIWQSKLLNKLKLPANDRTILWVYEEVGNVGKSRLVKHLVCEHDAVLLSGKTENMTKLYNGESIVVFDIPRTEVECVKHLFSIAEKLKNGMFVSGKYEVQLKVFDVPHVVFFANFLPEEGVWSADRLEIIDLNNPLWHTNDVPNIF